MIGLFTNFDRHFTNEVAMLNQQPDRAAKDSIGSQEEFESPLALAQLTTAMKQCVPFCLLAARGTTVQTTYIMTLHTTAISGR